MKSTATRFVFGALALALLAGCGSGNGGSGSSDTIKIGLNYELSGAVATYGQASVQGIKMAVDEVNAAGGVDGKQVQLVEYDNRSDPSEATTLAQRLMTQDDVISVIGPATSGSYKATRPVANSEQVPIVSGSATADDVTVENGKVQEYVFRVCYTDAFQGTAIANYASNKLNAKTAAVLGDTSSDYAKGLNTAFTTQFTANGGSIVANEAYTSGDTNFNAVLTRLRGQSFDVLYVPGYYNEAGLIIKQARELGITAPILGADGFDSPTLLQLAGATALSDVYFTNHYSSLDQDPRVQKFIADYKAANGEDPNAFNALGYDAANFVMDAVKRASNKTGPGVKDAMASTTDFEGVTGTFSVDADHNPVKEIVVIEMQNGEAVSSEKV